MKGIVEFIKKHDSTILTCIGSLGVISTAVLGIKATPKAIKIINEEKEIRKEKTKLIINDEIFYNDEITNYEIFKLVWKEYIPMTLSGIGTISCIFGANILNKRSQASLMSSYMLLSKYFNEYKYEASKTYELDEQSNANQTIQKKILEKHVKTEIPNDIYVDNDEVLVYCPIYATTHFNNGYITTKREALVNLETKINAEIYKEGYICINKIYKWLGVEKDKLPAWGWQYGWVRPYDVNIDKNGDKEIEYYDDSNEYQVKVDLTKCTIDEGSMEGLDCWFMDLVCPPEMQSFV